MRMTNRSWAALSLLVVFAVLNSACGANASATQYSQIVMPTGGRLLLDHGSGRSRAATSPGSIPRRSSECQYRRSSMGNDNEEDSKTYLKARMLGGVIPDSFQTRAGAELMDTWVSMVIWNRWMMCFNPIISIPFSPGSARPGFLSGTPICDAGERPSG